MPHCKEQVTAEICVELQIATAKALKYIELAQKCICATKPFQDALRRRDRISDLDQFINGERFDRSLAES